jgi:hypothetical protein
MQHDAEAAVRWFHECRRSSAAESGRRQREERRARLVEGALVTVRVAKHTPKNTSRMSDATMEADGTSAGSCPGCRTIDTDSIVLSSCSTSAGGAVRPRGGMDGTDGLGGKRKGARQERLIDGMIRYGSSNNRSAASEAAAAPTPWHAEGAIASTLTAEHSITSLDLWQVETCAICLEHYKENECVSYSRHRNCAHAFHTPCILSWLKDEVRNDCPCCRGPYLHLCVVEDDGDYLGVKASRPMGAAEGVHSRC